MGKNVKGHIFNLKKYAVHDGPGIRTTVFFQGCPLNCWWCHNPESQVSSENGIPVSSQRNCLRPYHRQLPYEQAWEVTAEEILDEIRKDRIFYEESGGGVTFSGGEPFMQPRFLEELLNRCREEGIHTVVDTSGYVSTTVLQKLLGRINLLLFDLKFVNNDKQFRYTAVSVKPVLKNLDLVVKHAAEVIVRIPLIPGITDTDENLSQLADYLDRMEFAGEINLLAYNPLGEDKYKKLNKERKLGKLKHQTPDELDHMKTFFEKYRFDVTYG